MTTVELLTSSAVLSFPSTVFETSCHVPTSFLSSFSASSAGRVAEPCGITTVDIIRISIIGSLASFLSHKASVALGTIEHDSESSAQVAISQAQPAEKTIHL
jgi:hypothetical protein